MNSLYGKIPLTRHTCTATEDLMLLALGALSNILLGLQLIIYYITVLPGEYNKQNV